MPSFGLLLHGLQRAHFFYSMRLGGWFARHCCYPVPHVRRIRIGRGRPSIWRYILKPLFWGVPDIRNRRYWLIWRGPFSIFVGSRPQCNRSYSAQSPAAIHARKNRLFGCRRSSAIRFIWASNSTTQNTNGII